MCLVCIEMSSMWDLNVSCEKDLLKLKVLKKNKLFTRTMEEPTLKVSDTVASNVLY